MAKANIKILFFISIIIASFVYSDDSTQEKPIYGGLEDYIRTLPRHILDNLAMYSEYLVRKFRNQEQLIGGIHDSLRFMEDSEVIEYVLTNVQKNPEIRNTLSSRALTLLRSQEATEKFYLKIAQADRQVLESLALEAEEYYKKENGMEFLMGGIHDVLRFMTDKEVLDYLKEKVEQYPDMIPVLLKRADEEQSKLKLLGGLEDYIHNFSIEDLRKMTLASERYDRERRGIQIMGGVHDYLYTMSKDDMIKFILDYCNKYPELRRPGVIESIAFENHFEKGVVLEGLSRQNLERIALQLEEHDRKQRGIEHIRGGLHDRLRLMTDEEVQAYILKVGEKYPEYFQQIFQEAKDHLRMGGYGGLHDYIWRLPRTTLVEYAIATEKYVNKQRGEILIGGIHDYIQKLTNEEIITYIMKHVDSFPELGKSGFIEGLLNSTD